MTQFSTRKAATHRPAEAAGPALHHRIEGSGTGLVLFHELGGSLESWADVVAHLGSGFRILRFDQRGHGLSGKPVTAFSMADHARDAARLAAPFGHPVWVIGVAAGAAAALQFAVLFPEKTAGLILCAPALSCDPDRIAYLQQRSASALRDGMQAIEAAALAQSYPIALRTDQPRFERYRAQWLANDPVSYGMANQALMQMQPERTLAALRALACPCLVIAGSGDGLRPPAYVRGIAAKIDGARFVEIESGHLMPVQAPREVAQHIARFVRAHPTRQSTEPAMEEPSR